MHMVAYKHAEKAWHRDLENLSLHTHAACAHSQSMPCTKFDTSIMSSTIAVMDLLRVRNKIINLNIQHNFSLKCLEFSISNDDHIILNLQTK